MGIEYSAKLLVGLPQNEMDVFFNDSDGDIAGYCEAKGLTYASPYYDAPSYHWVIGVQVARTDDFDWNTISTFNHIEAHNKFREITGMEGKLILSTHGY